MFARAVYFWASWSGSVLHWPEGRQQGPRPGGLSPADPAHVTLSSRRMRPLPCGSSSGASYMRRSPRPA